MKPKPKSTLRDGRVPVDPGEEERSVLGGSPHDEACTNIDSHGTAGRTSAPEGINAAAARPPRAVPLYLIAQVVAAEVARHKRALREIHVTCTAGHCYAITTVAGEDTHA